EPLESRIQYAFRQPKLLEEALSHPSLRYETRKNIPDNQRLEFLGDAVLQLVLSDTLFQKLPHADEGLLTKLRTRLVSSRALLKLAQQIHLVDYIKMGRGEEANKGREREAIQADALEALIGAIYVDGTFEAARWFILRLVDTELKAVLATPIEVNPKGQLQEILQGLTGLPPNYDILESQGPDHEKLYAAAAFWQGRELGRGKGSSKKDAEINAATMALQSQVLKSLLKELGGSDQWPVSAGRKKL
ncbi:MAG: ribonuclease III, partial [Methylococcaceae bacterium]